MKQLLYRIEDDGSLEDAFGQTAAAAAALGPRTILMHLYCGSICEKGDGNQGSLADRVLRRAGEVLPDAQLVGISSGGEICGGAMTQPCILLSVFLLESSWARVLPFHDVVSQEHEAGRRLLDEVQRHPDIQGVELLFAGRDIDSSAVYESLKQCRPKLPFFGGYAVEHSPEADSAFLLTSDGMARNAMAAVLYGGDQLHVSPGRTTGWKPLGSTFCVTRAQGRRLYTVNGIPAYDLYDQFLKFPEGESFQSYAMEFPLMLLKGKMRLLRHPLERYSDSSILLDGRVEEGDSICLSYGSPLEIIRKMNERCEKIRAFEPEAILVYSCQGRKSYWGDLVDWELEPFQKVAQTGGACLAGQIMRNNQTGRVIEHRLTLLSVAMREGEKTGRSIPDVTVDDDILKGRMSLVHRMSMLVESTVEGLQKTNSVLREMNERLARANDELHRMAVTDELTGLCNRREIERRIKASLERTQDSKKEISLVMLDIDFFKKVNDTYGHDAGDAALKDVSAILQECIDESHGEAAGRWGGEEFFVLLPDKGFGEAMALAERIRSVVERHDFPRARHLTVSLGVTCANADTNYQAIFIQADQALYDAKHNGRNRVEGCSAAVRCDADAADSAGR